jgi:hypothetical protein
MEALRYKVKISNISFDMELEEITPITQVEEIKSPVLEAIQEEIPPVEVVKKEIPPVETIEKEIKSEDFTDEFYRLVNDPSVSDIYLEEKKHFIRWIKNTRISRHLKIHSGPKRANLVFGLENNSTGQEGVLFTMVNGGQLVTDNVNFCQPKQKKNTNTFLPQLLKSAQDPSAKWTAIIRNCDTTANGRNGGFGIGFVYGGLFENHIALINFKHVGQGLIDAKNPYQNSVLYLTMKEVEADFSNNTEFSDYKLLVKGKVTPQNFQITSDHEMDFFYNHFFVTDKNDNYATILHVGRFTFMIDDSEAVIDPKNVRLRPNANGDTLIRVIEGKVYTIGKESHAGDSFSFYGKTFTCTEKWRDEHPIWSNNHNPSGLDIAYHPFLKTDLVMEDGYYQVEWKSSFDLEGIEQEMWIIYKSGYSFRSYPKTKFGNWEILSGQVMGHQMYNHDVISLWAENVKITGYYRQTQDNGKTLGYNMVNCSGFADEFHPPVEVTSSKPMPERISSLL